MTDVIDPNKGNLIGFKNYKKQHGDKRPAFTGRLSLPGATEERGFSLWAVTSKDGAQTLLTGSARQDAKVQIDDMAMPKDKIPDPEAAVRIIQSGGKDLTIDPNGMLLFSNKQKDKEHADRPDYWGYYNPGRGERLVKLAVWTRTDRAGNVMLTGNLQRDEPAKERELPPAKPKTKTKTKTKTKSKEMAR